MPDPVAPLVVLAGSSGAYALGVRRVWGRAGKGRVVHAGQVACFAAGQVALAAVLVGPVDHLSASWLSAHMVQHLVIVAVAAPLLVTGAPLPAMLWALPAPVRDAPSAWWRRVNRSQAGPRWWAWTVGAVLAHSVALWAWHVPALYDAAAQDEALHALQHASFLATAVVFWWMVAGARRRATYGIGVGAIFVVALEGIALGALMTLSGSPWYETYATSRVGAGVTALEDQQIAGAIMWCPGGFIYVTAAAALLLTRLLGEERASPARPSWAVTDLARAES